MTYKPLLLVLPILCILTSSINGYNLMLGTIQFPKTMKTVPNVRIYYSGKIVSGKIDKSDKSISFSIPKYSQNQMRYTLLVTESIEFATPKATETPGNIIEHMRIPSGNDYKLYTLLLVPRFSDDPAAQSKPNYHWRILPDQAHGNKIPDDALILILDPKWIETVEGENSFELPTIKLKPNVVELSGSAENFYDKSAQLLLAAIDSDTIHGSVHSDESIKQEKNRITIAAPVA
jgi:hypothetical protein